MLKVRSKLFLNLRVRDLFVSQAVVTIRGETLDEEILESVLRPLLPEPFELLDCSSRELVVLEDFSPEGGLHFVRFLVEQNLVHLDSLDDGEPLALAHLDGLHVVRGVDVRHEVPLGVNHVVAQNAIFDPACVYDVTSVELLKTDASGCEVGFDLVAHCLVVVTSDTAPPVNELFDSLDLFVVNLWQVKH